MKKIFFASLAIAAITMASCSQDEAVRAPEGDGNVSFSAKLPAIASRAFADGTTASQLTYYVYDAEAATGSEPVISGTETFGDDLTANVNLSLVTGKKYDIVFWASAPDATCYTYSTSDRAITVTYSGEANDEKRDAFFNTVQSLEVKGAINQTVILNRPFAQVNVGTSDLDIAAAAGFELTTTGLKMALPTTLNLMDGTVSGEEAVAVEFTQTAIPTDETFPIEPTTYKYISMNYVLTGADKSIVDLTLTTDHPNRPEIAFNSVPVQRNYRTNIFGALLTNPANFEVKIDQEFATPDFDVKVVETAEDLKAAIEAGADVEIPAQAEITIDEPLTLTDGQEVTVNGTLSSEKAVFVVPAEANVTIKGEGTIDWTYASDGIAEGGTWAVNAIEVHGNATIEDVTISNPDNHVAGSLFYVRQGAEVTFNNVVANTGYRALTTAPGTKVTINGGEFNSTSHNGYHASNGNSRYAYSIVVDGVGTVAELNGVKVTGIQGGIAVSKSCSAVLNDCDVYVADPENPGKPGRAFYAVYTAQSADVTINSGKYYSPRFACYSGDNDITGDSFGSMALKGGKFSSVAWSQQSNMEYPLPAGYKWQETGDTTYPYEVVKE